jgi:hypothetical protein
MRIDAQRSIQKIQPDVIAPFDTTVESLPRITCASVENNKISPMIPPLYPPIKVGQMRAPHAPYEYGLYVVKLA